MQNDDNIENSRISFSDEKTDKIDKTEKIEKNDTIDKKLLVQSAIQGLLIAVIMILVALLIDWTSIYWFVDILFFEGMIALLSGLVHITGGIPIGVSTKGLGQKNPQADATMKIEIQKKEEEIRQKKSQSSGKSRKFMLSILFAGAICTMIDIILVLIL